MVSTDPVSSGGGRLVRDTRAVNARGRAEIYVIPVPLYLDDLPEYFRLVLDYGAMLSLFPGAWGRASEMRSARPNTRR